MSSAQRCILLVGCLLIAGHPSGGQQVGPMSPGFDLSALMTDAGKDVFDAYVQIQANINASMPALTQDVSYLHQAFGNWLDANNKNAVQWVNNMTSVLKQYFDEMRATVATMGPKAAAQTRTMGNDSIAFSEAVKPIIEKYLNSTTGTIGDTVGELLPLLIKFLLATESSVKEFSNMGVELNKNATSSPRIMQAVRLIADYNELQGNNTVEYLRKSLLILKNMTLQLSPSTSRVDRLMATLAATQIRAVLDSPLREVERFVAAMLQQSLQPLYGILNQSGSLLTAPNPQSAGFILRLYGLLANATPPMLEHVMNMTAGSWMSMSPNVTRATLNGSASVRSMLLNRVPPELIQIFDALFLSSNVSSNQFATALNQTLVNAQKLYFGDGGGLSLRKLLAGNFVQNVTMQMGALPPQVARAVQVAAESVGSMVPALDHMFNSSHDLASLRAFLRSVRGFGAFQQLYSGDGDIHEMLLSSLGSHLTNSSIPGLNLTLSGGHGLIDMVSAFYDSLFINGPATMASVLQNATILPKLMAINTTNEISQLLAELDAQLTWFRDQQAAASQSLVTSTKQYIDEWISLEEVGSKLAVSTVFTVTRNQLTAAAGMLQPLDLKWSVLRRVVMKNATDADRAEMTQSFVKWISGVIRSQSLETQNAACQAVDIMVGLSGVAKTVLNETCLKEAPTGTVLRNRRQTAGSIDSAEFQKEMTDFLQKAKTILQSQITDPTTLGYVDMLLDAATNWKSLNSLLAPSESQTVMQVLQDAAIGLMQTLLNGGSRTTMLNRIKQILTAAEDALMNQVQASILMLNTDVVDRMRAAASAVGDFSQQLSAFASVVDALPSGAGVSLQQVQDAMDGKGSANVLNAADTVVRSMTNESNWQSLWLNLNKTATATAQLVTKLLDTDADMLPISLLSRLNQFQSNLQSLNLTGSDFKLLKNITSTLFGQLDLAAQSLQMPPEVLMFFSASGGLDDNAASLVGTMMAQYATSLLAVSQLLINKQWNTSELSQMANSWNEINKIRIQVFSSLPGTSRETLAWWKSVRDRALALLSQYHIDLAQLRPFLDWIQGKAVADTRQMIIQPVVAFASAILRETLLRGHRVQCGTTGDISNLEYFVFLGTFAEVKCVDIMAAANRVTTPTVLTSTTPDTSGTTAQMSAKLTVNCKVDAPWNDDLKDTGSANYDHWNTECKSYVQKVVSYTPFKDSFKEAKNCSFRQGSIVMESNVDMTTSVSVAAFAQQVQAAVSSNAELKTIGNYQVTEISASAPPTAKPGAAPSTVNLTLILAIAIPLGVIVIVAVAVGVYLGTRSKKIPKNAVADAQVQHQPAD